jgi:hypothetical protein
VESPPATTVFFVQMQKSPILWVIGELENRVLLTFSWPSENKTCFAADLDPNPWSLFMHVCATLTVTSPFVTIFSWKNWDA